MSSHPNLKLTQAMVKEAGKLVADGHRYKSLYRHFGVSDETWRTYLRHGNPGHTDQDENKAAQRLKESLWKSICKGLLKCKKSALKGLRESAAGKKLKKKKVVTEIVAQVESKTRPRPTDFKTQLWPVKEGDEHDVFLVKQVITEEELTAPPNHKAAIWLIERTEKHEDMISNVSELPEEMQELAKVSVAALIREARTNPQAAEAFLKVLGKWSG